MKLLLLITALGCSVVQAGSAAYLADGKRVIRSSEKGLWLKSLVDFSEVPVKYPKGFSPGWSSVTRLPEGEILVARGAKAMTWDPTSGKWDLFCTAPKEKTFEDVACEGAQEVAPMIGWLLVTRKRMHGSGYGAIVRVPNDDAYKKHLALKWEELEEVDGGGLLALSPDGKQSAAYITAQHRWFVLEKPDGELLPLPSSEKK